MAYLRLNYHVVFSTKHRVRSIDRPWRGRLHEYLGGTILGLGGAALSQGIRRPQRGGFVLRLGWNRLPGRRVMLLSRWTGGDFWLCSASRYVRPMPYCTPWVSSFAMGKAILLIPRFRFSTGKPKACKR